MKGRRAMPPCPGAVSESDATAQARGYIGLIVAEMSHPVITMYDMLTSRHHGRHDTRVVVIEERRDDPPRSWIVMAYWLLRGGTRIEKIVTGIIVGAIVFGTPIVLLLLTLAARHASMNP